jgi:hypothetical protein
MVRVSTALAIGAASVLWIAPLWGQVDWQAEARQYGWHLSLAAAQQEARTQQKPLMIVIRCIP